MTVAASGAKFYNIDSPLEVYYVRLDSHGRRNKRVPIRASIAYFKLFTDVASITTPFIGDSTLSNSSDGTNVFCSSSMVVKTPRYQM